MNTTGIVGWAPEPEGRGTIGLVWSCLATILLCTWNAIHLNLPAQNQNPMQLIWRRMKYLMVALVAPEYFCIIAIKQLYEVRWVQAQSPNWSLTQCFFLAMGGFVIRCDEELIRLQPGKLLELFDTGALPWPEVTESEIMDRSKADWILKSLALAQVVWFVAQVVARAAQDLSMTTLELFTLGIIFCALVDYSAWWAKPFDVYTPIVIELKTPLPEGLERVRYVGITDIGFPRHEGPKRISVLGTCVTVVFAALHFIGWRFHFPTGTELWLWRASSIACIVLPLIVIVVVFYPDPDNIKDPLGVGVLGVLYIVCRLSMMVEMFISLRAVPADVYKTPQWSQYFPTFG